MLMIVKRMLYMKLLKINRALCSILVQRGFDDFDKAKQYFRPQLNGLHDPFLMKDMDKAVQRILTAFNNKEKIYWFLAIMMWMALLRLPACINFCIKFMNLNY